MRGNANWGFEEEEPAKKTYLPARKRKLISGKTRKKTWEEQVKTNHLADVRFLRDIPISGSGKRKRK